MQPLQIELPQPIFDKLSQVAAQKQQPLEKVAVEWLTLAATEIDPLDALIGSISSEPFDVDIRHDEYLAQQLATTIR
jgi:hypothetical protein